MHDATFLTSFQEGPHQKLFFHGKKNFFNSASKMANWIVVVVKYLINLMLSLVFFIYFFDMGLREPEKKNKRQESEDERKG